MSKDAVYTQLNIICLLTRATGWMKFEGTVLSEMSRV